MTPASGSISRPLTGDGDMTLYVNVPPPRILEEERKLN